MRHLVPVLLIAAVAGCTQSTDVSNAPDASQQAGTTAPGAAEGQEGQAGQAQAAQRQTAAAQPGREERPPVQGDPFNAPRAPSSQPARAGAPPESDSGAQAAASGGADGRLGSTTASVDASLGPIDFKTPLVSQPTRGRVLYVPTGREYSVQLIPSGGPSGGGSQISIQGMRWLGAPLTGLPEVVVYAN